MKSNFQGKEPLLSDFDGDQEISELIELFVAEMPGKVHDLLEAFEKGRTDQLVRLAHEIGEGAMSYGFPSIMSAAMDVEKSGKGDKDIEDLRLQIDALVNLCSRAGISP
ncbi:MAG TPA: Hpt domain-containing protein [Phycisphaeraceae bacterium]|nr:Hpt domain-containing protein [Phycisphaeraceae bacterium]